MIQRIQSVYLALGAVALLALFLFGVIWDGAATQFGWFPPTLTVLILLTALAAIGTIFAYSNRAQQRKYVVGVQVLTVLLMLVFYGGLFLADGLAVMTTEGTDISKLAALLMPVAAYILFLLARKGIESDIALVRSMDRLR